MFLKLGAALLLLVNHVKGHGHIMEPKSRNYRAWKDGAEWGNNANVPKKEYTPQGLNNQMNTVSSQCGVGQAGGVNYDFPPAANGQSLTWQSQATYQQGATITVKIALTAYHRGYFEFRACPRNQQNTQACFNKYPLTFVSDPKYGTQKDNNNPMRAYAPNVASVYNGDGFYAPSMNYEFQMKLPSGLSGDALLQMIYYTDNGTGERFWNCAEVTVAGGGGPVPAPVSAPTSSGTCGGGNIGNGKCSNGQCCSQWGWCGTTADYCGSVTKLGDWSGCSSSSQCSNGCCSG